MVVRPLATAHPCLQCAGQARASGCQWNGTVSQQAASALDNSESCRPHTTPQGMSAPQQIWGWDKSAQRPARSTL